MGVGAKQQKMSRWPNKCAGGLLGDLVLGAVTNGLQTSRKTQEEEMGKIAAGVNIPGLGM